MRAGTTAVAFALVGWLALAMGVCAAAPCSKVGWLLLGELPKRCGGRSVDAHPEREHETRLKHRRKAKP